MNPGRFYMPNYLGARASSMMSPMMGLSNITPRGMGFFSRITNGIRSVNWGTLLNNANKTLNVVNQTIPLVRQAGPMFNNMKSMLRIAKAFGSETNTKNANNNTNYDKSNTPNNKSYNNIVLANEKEVISDNTPNFFV